MTLEEIELPERKRKKPGIEHYTDGRIFFAKHEYQKAVECFNQAYKEKYYLASFWLYHLYNSDFYGLQNNFQENNFSLIISVHLLPCLFMHNAERDRLLILGYFHQHGMFAMKKSYEEARKCYSEYEILLQGKTDIFHCLFKADLEFSERNYETAQQEYKKILAIDNQFNPALYGFAKCQKYVKLVSDYRMVHICFEATTKFLPQDPIMWHEWGLVCERQRNYSLALEKLKIAYDLQPTHIYYAVAYIDILLKLDQPKEAESICKEILIAQPLQPIIINRLEQIRYEFKNTSMIPINTDKAEEKKVTQPIVFMEKKYSSPAFFPVVENVSLIYPSRKISKSKWLLLLACEISDENLKWKQHSNLFLERINDKGEYILERYYLERTPDHIPPICIEQINKELDSLSHFYFSPTHVFAINEILGSELMSDLNSNSQSKAGFIPPSRISTLCRTEWNSFIWCTGVLQKFRLKTPTIKELPGSLEEALPKKSANSCIIS